MFTQTMKKPTYAFRFIGCTDPPLSELRTQRKLLVWVEPALALDLLDCSVSGIVLFLQSRILSYTFGENEAAWHLLRRLAGRYRLETRAANLLDRDFAERARSGTRRLFAKEDTGCIICALTT